jgi:hypothetical protein
MKPCILVGLNVQAASASPKQVGSCATAMLKSRIRKQATYVPLLGQKEDVGFHVAQQRRVPDPNLDGSIVWLELELLLLPSVLLLTPAEKNIGPSYSVYCW